MFNIFIQGYPIKVYNLKTGYLL